MQYILPLKDKEPKGNILARTFSYYRTGGMFRCDLWQGLVKREATGSLQDGALDEGFKLLILSGCGKFLAA
jgi:hypothetical protein